MECDAHTLRAAQLADPRRRARLADSIRRAAAASSARRGAGVPVCRAAVLEARPALLALADDLVEVRDPSPRGIALLHGGGPLDQPMKAAELRAAAEGARHAL